jgi:hypothetical protein
MEKFQIIHKHETGMTLHNFESEYDLQNVFNSLHDGDDDELAIEFANKVLGIDYEPDKGEYLEFFYTDVEFEKIDVIDKKFLEYL